MALRSAISNSVMTALLATLSAAPVPATAQTGRPTPNALLETLNSARIDPPGFAETYKGPRSADVAETLSFLRAHPPVPPLIAEPLLDRAAARHVADQASVRSVGHVGTDGSTLRDRIQGEGVFTSITAEEIALSATNPSAAVWQLLIDLGEPGKKHRIDVMSPTFQYMGAACGPQVKYQSVCVIDLTGTIIARRPPVATAPEAVPKPPPDCWQWIDAQNGHVVDADHLVPNGGRLDPADAKHISFGGRTFFRAGDGSWTDAQNGHVVDSDHLVPNGGRIDPTDPHHVAFGGRTFVKVPCPTSHTP